MTEYRHAAETDLAVLESLRHAGVTVTPNVTRFGDLPYLESHLKAALERLADAGLVEVVPLSDHDLGDHIRITNLGADAHDRAAEIDMYVAAKASKGLDPYDDEHQVRAIRAEMIESALYDEQER